MADTTKPTPKPTATPSTGGTVSPGLASAAKALGLSAQDLADARALAGAKTSASKTTKTPITKTYYPQVYSDTQARKFIEDQFQAVLKRPATPAEITQYAKLLKSAQQDLKNAAVQNYKATGSTAVSGTTTGLDEAQWFLDNVQKDKALAAEYNTVKTQAPDLTKLAADKKIYDNAIAAAKGDFEKINTIKQTTNYGRSLTELEAQINDKILNEGATNDPGEVAQIAKYLLDRGLDLRSKTGLSYLEGQLKFGKNKVSAGGKTTDAYTGTAGKTVDALNKVALANGLTLDNVFDAATLGDVLSSINKGEDISTYTKLIRDAAKVAWNVPDNVAKLMDQGVSLDAIYQPYKNTYASTLELNPNDVKLSDLAKFGIIGQQSAGSQAPQNLYDFQKALRKDDRWQFTQQAHQEVSSAVQKVLQDFGFMG